MVIKRIDIDPPQDFNLVAALGSIAEIVTRNPRHYLYFSVYWDAVKRIGTDNGVFLGSSINLELADKFSESTPEKTVAAAIAMQEYLIDAGIVPENAVLVEDDDGSQTECFVCDNSLELFSRVAVLTDKRLGA